ncbi:MAG TPA: AtpZ/AtpI family protein [Candidatus Polarisedimenticolaceae bacterium]|nr:AtpZ/AtpI family protein [Candidatus Polarisedimenticolaceae bacterium]
MVNQQGGGVGGGRAPSPLRFVGIGFEILGPLLVGVFGGRWLDGRLGTQPWLLLVGAVLGAVTGMLNFYRRVVA